MDPETLEAKAEEVIERANLAVNEFAMLSDPAIIAWEDARGYRGVGSLETVVILSQRNQPHSQVMLPDGKIQNATTVRLDLRLSDAASWLQGN